MINSETTAFVAFTSSDKQTHVNSYNRNDNNLLSKLTISLVPIYKKCNPSFKSIQILPQRLLTNPAEGVFNNGLDNEECYLICRVHDRITSNKVYSNTADHKRTFIILDSLGTGTFGQVFRCQIEDSKEIVAVKIIKNKPAYYTQGLLEIKILKMLNQVHDPNDSKHIVRLLDSFEYQSHLCLVFELLSMSLLDVLTQNQYRGLPLSVVQRFTKQIVTALVILEESNVIHCDLKPENILLSPPKSNRSSQNNNNKSINENNQIIKQSESSSNRNSDSNENNSTIDESQIVTENNRDSFKSNDDNNNNDSNINSDGIQLKSSPSSEYSMKRSSISSDIKVIDFGSACFEGKSVYSYIQSRFYRSPEVLLGIPYNGAIDMWSLACVCAEMYLGLPLFPGVSQHNQLSRIIDMLGMPPDFVIEGKNGAKYFILNNQKTENYQVSNIPTKYRFKTAEEYAFETKTEVPILRKYLRYNRLDEVVLKCPLPNKSKLTPEQKTIEMNRRRCFLDFLLGLLNLNPFERWTPKQAIQHPFITNMPYTATFQPPVDLKAKERKLMYSIHPQPNVPRSNAAPLKNDDMTSLLLNRPPSNFSSGQNNTSNFVPLTHQHRRQSEPFKPLNKELQSSEEAAHFSNKPVLKRGNPVHINSSNNEKSNVSNVSVDNHLNKGTIPSAGEKQNKSNTTQTHKTGTPKSKGIPPIQPNQQSQNEQQSSSLNSSYMNTSNQQIHPTQYVNNQQQPITSPPQHQSMMSQQSLLYSPSGNLGMIPMLPAPHHQLMHPGAAMLPPPVTIGGNINYSYNDYSFQQNNIAPSLPINNNNNNQQPHIGSYPIPTANHSYNVPVAAAQQQSYSMYGNSYNNMAYQNNQMSGSMYSMGSSFSGGAFGSVDGDMIISEFGFALTRPELDEQRLMMSQNPSMIPASNYGTQKAHSVSNASLMQHFMPYHGDQMHTVPLGTSPNDAYFQQQYIYYQQMQAMQDQQQLQQQQQQQHQQQLQQIQYQQHLSKSFEAQQYAMGVTANRNKHNNNTSNNHNKQTHNYQHNNNSNKMSNSYDRHNQSSVIVNSNLSHQLSPSSVKDTSQHVKRNDRGDSSTENNRDNNNEHSKVDGNLSNNTNSKSSPNKNRPHKLSNQESQNYIDESTIEENQFYDNNNEQNQHVNDMKVSVSNSSANKKRNSGTSESIVDALADWDPFFAADD
eukprot:gene10567-14194_t